MFGKLKTTYVVIKDNVCNDWSYIRNTLNKIFNYSQNDKKDNNN